MASKKPLKKSKAEHKAEWFKLLDDLFAADKNPPPAKTGKK